MLTSRQRLERCFRGEPVDRPGVYCRTGIPASDPSYDPLRELLKTKTDLKAGWSCQSVVEAIPVQTRTESHSDAYERRIETLHTPAGELVKTWLSALNQAPGMTEKHLLETRKDAEKYLSLPLPRIGEKVDGFFEQDRLIGDRGIVDAGLGLNPAGFTADLFGSEQFAMLSITDRDILHAICERRMRIILATIDYVCDHGVGPFFSMLGQEYLVPPLHGREDFFDFNVRYDRPIVERIHECGGWVHIHCHGPLRAVLDGFLEIGNDVLHPIEPPPMGDIEAREARRVLGDRICIEGNIQIADMYEHSPAQIREQTVQLIQDAFIDHKGLIVCPTASPWIYGAGAQCIEQFLAMVDVVVNWK